MPNDILGTFLSASSEQRLKMVRDEDNSVVLKAYFGEAAYAEYRQLADRLDRDHLGVESPKNLIFLPGVMGSLLLSKTKGGIWWIDLRTRQHIDDLALAPNGLNDADPTHQIAPITSDPTYEPFLTAVLARDDFGHEVFPYDWRKPLQLSSAALKDLIFKLYNENGNQPVHLVAHSMGGLMVRAALLDHGHELWPKLGRIVFLGTPHYGSLAIAGYLKNHMWGFDLMAVLGMYLSRDTFRSLWGPIGMLPAPRGIYPDTHPGDANGWHSGHNDDLYQHPCANFDMYQADSWALDLTTAQTTQLQQVLDGAATFHRQLYQAHQALDQTLRDRMLVIAGVGYQTLFRLAYAKQFFGLWERTTKETGRIAGNPHRDGDGRVPLASAALENVAIRYVRGVHGSLPNIPAVFNDVFHWLKAEPLQLPSTTFEALSGHLASGEGDSETPSLDGSARAMPFSDDAGLWTVDQSDPNTLSALRAQLEAEKLPEFTRVRIL